MSTRNGYTLIETVIVLLTLSVVIAIAVPFHSKTVDALTFQTFYQQFEDDVLLTQQLSMTNQAFYDLMILPSQQKYFLLETKTERKVLERSIPDTIKLELQTLKVPVRFSSDGTIYSPGSMRIKTNSKSYRVVFPFGKSRCYMYEI
ncbi:hypothetical protein GCM10007216_22880 [Thalassobacillus devorans]|uniref:Competence protein ComGD n=1 Tax=Thalassobacillus devorans TaxID=279813 RepID=A0ABQ1P687_9BACI|nr:competence type IV pilus minor pilin ComGD [Thalassobacillus devorans]NIK29628.1 competence protein ComGD [Thalassobacillus devorans]GGC91612.1 hypothetical protein GCM10007216_22880 [Thalassobacillus devorans]